jgi:hypothetical protein
VQDLRIYDGHYGAELFLKQVPVTKPLLHHIDIAFSGNKKKRHDYPYILFALLLPNSVASCHFAAANTIIVLL